MAKRRRRELIEADERQAKIISLLRIRHPDWTEWEQEWLEDEARRADDYVYTDKEEAILRQLMVLSNTFTHYSQVPVSDLVQLAYSYRKDFNEDDEAFVEQLHRWRATDLKLRQVSRLASVCRLIESLARDERVDELMRAAKRRESSDEQGDVDQFDRIAW